ncbi:hypothetical protein [Microbacterium sp. C7(2022)]|uniref:hypothetical protein n=1 Tax=Microbacterium sp. C7(2022) TaxID=2992759 RepID=UPI00237A120A|nr:hypothetical protein [Microbacterium sp. C7(2022)]MDE0545354.1 hypothetical protein [Microbacterium sp. C7(2022)]
MTSPLRVSAFGVVVEVDLSTFSEPDAALVRAAWADALADPDAEVETWVTPREGVEIDVMLSDLSTRVTLAAIDARRGQFWMLHAAGLALDNGQVVAFVGPSGRGKTTASRALGARFGYVTDETVAIDASGRVWPYRKPLSIIEAGARVKVQRAPSSIGLRAVADVPLQLAAVVVLDRISDTEKSDAAALPVAERIDLGDAINDLVEQSSYLSLMPAPLQTIAAHVEAVGGVLRVTYSEAQTLLAIMPELVQEYRAPVVETRAEIIDATAAVAGAPGTYSRGPAHDVLALEDPDRLITLHLDDEGLGTVRVLSGIAPALWRAAEATPFEGLVQAALDAYGQPEDVDATDLVCAAVDDLVAAGVLVEGGAE